MDSDIQSYLIATEDHWVVKILDHLVRGHEKYYFIEVFHDSELEREWSVEERLGTYRNGPELLTAFRSWYSQFRDHYTPNILTTDGPPILNREVNKLEMVSNHGTMSAKLLAIIEDLIADGYFSFQLGFLDKYNDRRSSYLHFIESVHDTWESALFDRNLYFPLAIVTFRNRVENYGSNYYSDTGRSMITVYKSDKFKELLDRCKLKSHFALVIDFGLPFINSEFGVCLVHRKKSIYCGIMNKFHHI